MVIRISLFLTYCIISKIGYQVLNYTNQTTFRYRTIQYDPAKWFTDLTFCSQLLCNYRTTCVCSLIWVLSVDMYTAIFLYGGSIMLNLQEHILGFLHQYDSTIKNIYCGASRQRKQSRHRLNYSTHQSPQENEVNPKLTSY